jgi:ubiquinone/menaquinone biosynthesis C-methylase UbiE
MGAVDENKQVWEQTWDWARAGEEWSDSWGGTPALWYGTLLPRIHSYVPTGTILEIAPGFGRWTEYLRRLCNRLIVVDLAANCIDHCKLRFAEDSHIEYHVNDGKSLGMVEDESIDFAFSFDSLVHADAEPIGSYLNELSRTLRPDGVGVIHHSNQGHYPHWNRIARRTPQVVLRRLVARGLMIDVFAWRSTDVTSETFALMCEGAGMSCISQELINWENGYFLTDVISTVTRQGSKWDRPNVVSRNPLFRLQATRLSYLYGERSAGTVS